MKHLLAVCYKIVVGEGKMMGLSHIMQKKKVAISSRPLTHMHASKQQQQQKNADLTLQPYHHLKLQGTSAFPPFRHPEAFFSMSQISFLPVFPFI